MGRRACGQEEGFPLAQRLVVRPWGNGLPVAASGASPQSACGASGRAAVGGGLDLLEGDLYGLLPSYEVLAAQAAADPGGRASSAAIYAGGEQHVQRPPPQGARANDSNTAQLLEAFFLDRDRAGDEDSGILGAAALPPALPSAGLQRGSEPRSALPPPGGVQGGWTGAGLSLDLAMLQPQQHFAARPGDGVAATNAAACVQAPGPGRLPWQEGGGAKRARA